jgi:cytochrome c oxidase cbb3-type subunit I/II
MWKQFTPLGVLQYPNFLETVLQIKPMFHIRAVGGVLYLSGVMMMAYNLIRTAKQGKFAAEEAAEAPALEREDSHGKENRHRWIEKRPVQFALLAVVVIAIGGLVEIIPTYLIKSNIPTIVSVKPYSPLELQGRDIYIREGCNNCHSQMVRPFRSETERYGEYSKAGEYVYDHPFLWGSKRTGPDLHRIGGKYPNLWHYLHMNEPASMSPGSIMPTYPWLLTQDLDVATTASKILVMQDLGVPYPKGYDARAVEDLRAQAEAIALDLTRAGAPAEPQKEIIALIAYLQRLGTDIKVQE